MMTIEEINATFILTSIIFCSVLFLVVKYNWSRRWLYYYGSKLDGPFAFPLIGSAHRFRGGKDVFCKKMMEIFEKYQPLSKMWLGNVLYVMPSRPKDVQILLNNCLSKGLSYEFGTQLIAYGLVTAPVEKWRRHRKIINLTFNQNILNSFMDIFAKYSNQLVDRLAASCDKEKVDLLPSISQCTLDIICETTMGVKANAMSEQNEYVSWMMRAEQLITYRLFNPWLRPNFIWHLSPLGKEVKLLCQKSWDFVKKIVETKRLEKAYIPISDQYETSTKRIFLDHLIDITDQEGKWTDEELMEETQTMVIAGSETSAIAQSNVFLMLAMHPEIQDRVQEELDEIFGDSDRDVSLEDLDKMVYLEMVIKESLRIFPVAPVVSRFLHNDVQLDTHVIPKGCVVFVPIIYIHRKPDLWPNPLKFDPDRFLPEECAKRHRYSYLPFSGGPRNCIGMKYAMMSMKAILASVLRRFRVESPEYKSISDIDLHINVLMKAAKGYKVAVTRRKNK